MGRGSYNSADWSKLMTSKGISQTSTADNIFGKNTVKEKYLPKFINMRESRDSEDSPESTPIIIGFDSTGSMGYLAAEIAKNSLNKTATMILDKRPVTDPHIMCAAFTSPPPHWSYGIAELQITQFEADIRVVEQLLDFKLGGGNRYSYDSLVWYFALKHTSTDCFEKRHKKGFIFCIGDEIGPDSADEIILKAKEIENIYNDKDEKDYSTKELIEEVGKKYELFHIITGDRVDNALKTWEKLMPGRTVVVRSENIQYLAEVMISLMQLVGGMDRDDVLKQWDGEARRIVESALPAVSVTKKMPGIGSLFGWRT